VKSRQSCVVETIDDWWYVSILTATTTTINKPLRRRPLVDHHPCCPCAPLFLCAHSGSHYLNISVHRMAIECSCPDLLVPRPYLSPRPSSSWHEYYSHLYGTTSVPAPLRPLPATESRSPWCMRLHISYAASRAALL
jgi:hypothetical protein